MSHVAVPAARVGVMARVQGVKEILARRVGTDVWASAVVLIFLGAAAVFYLLGPTQAIALALLAGGGFVAIAFLNARSKDEHEAVKAVHGPAPGNGFMRPRNSLQYVEALSAKDKNGLHEALVILAGLQARRLGVEPPLVRTNMFGYDDRGMLRMVPGLTHNIHGDELTVEMPPGYGCAGAAFEQGQPQKAVNTDGSWREFGIKASELRKVAPELRWIVAVPFSVDPASDQKPHYVVGVDGLRHMPTEAQLQQAVEDTSQASSPPGPQAPAASPELTVPEPPAAQEAAGEFGAGLGRP